MIYQNSAGVDPIPHKYGCLFLCLLRSKEVKEGYIWSPKRVNEAWDACMDAGAISDDINDDGDVDDPGEAEILSYNLIFNILGLPLVDANAIDLPFLSGVINNVRRTLPTSKPIDPSRYWVCERWTRQGGHFVQGDGTGLFPPIYDPWEGGSQTRKNGKLESLRVFPFRS